MNLPATLLPIVLAAGLSGFDEVSDQLPPSEPDSPDAVEPCDGEPPHLINKDGKDHPYTLTCNKKVEKKSIKPRDEHELEGKSGCKLKVGDNAPEKLFADMVCVIENGKVTCDLL
jgi:hypothetical protein